MRLTTCYFIFDEPNTTEHCKSPLDGNGTTKELVSCWVTFHIHFYGINLLNSATSCVMVKDPPCTVTSDVRLLDFVAINDAWGIW
jgi:hypothetical protein